MQFRTLSVAMAVLAVVVVVMAADPPTADVLHAKCYHDHDRTWWIAGEELDEEALKTVPREYQIMGWKKWKSGRCSYKSGHANCPNKWWGDEHHWDTHYGYKKLGATCNLDKECCSHNCLATTASPTAKKCCRFGLLGFNATMLGLTKANCCSRNITTVGVTPYCAAP